MRLPKTLTWQRAVIAGLLGLMLITGSALRFSRAAASKSTGALPSAPVTRPPVTQPSIIWFHSVSTNPLESLELALAQAIEKVFSDESLARDLTTNARAFVLERYGPVEARRQVEAALCAAC